MEDELKPVEDEEQGDVQEVSEETTPEEASGDDEFEYDEDGNIIIPDVAESEEEPDEDAEEESEEAAEETDAEADEEQPEETPKEDEKDSRIAALEKELAALKRQGKETLSKLGVQSENVLEGLEKVAAESEEVSIEEYRKKKAEKEQADETKRILQKTAFEQKCKQDLDELQKAYPETKSVKSIMEIENFKEFAEMRDKGLSVKQAYAAANPDGVRKSVANAVRQQNLNDTKAHLKSAVPKGSKDNSISMPKKELAEWRETFPDLSDKEIIALYKQSI